MDFTIEQQQRIVQELSKSVRTKNVILKDILEVKPFVKKGNRNGRKRI